MIVRKYYPEDAQQIQEIYDKHHHNKFGLPRLDRSIATCVVEKDNMILGFGALELYIEATMILDLGLSLKNKLAVLRHIIQCGEVATKLHGYDRFYASPSPDKFAHLLARHFDFVKCDPYYHYEVNSIFDQGENK